MTDESRLLKESVELFERRLSRKPDIAIAAPGRANIIGEHTDYNDGHVLPIAIDLYIVAAAANRSDSIFRFRAEDLDEWFEFDLHKLPDRWPTWAAYLLGIVIELGKEGFSISGKDILIHGNIPIGSGLSSSAALEISTATAIERLDGFAIDDARLVNICRRADHNYVGIKSGPMDQFASRACRAGHAGLLDCRSLEMTDHRLPEGVDFLSIYSGIPRQLADSEYNERQGSCRKAVETLRKADPEIKALRDANLELVESMKNELGELVYRRARHVTTEQLRVFELVEAFQSVDLSRMGQILLEGHRSLSEDYEVSLPILDEMVEWLYRRPGVVGARLTGAGFGGSLICLAKADELDREKLKVEFASRFAERTPEPPQVWRLASVDGAKYQVGYSR